MSIFTKTVIAIALGGSSLAGTSAALAQAVTENVLVTGDLLVPTDTVSKSPIPFLENPQTTSVVTQDLLQDQGITRLADALRNVAGVSRSSTYGYFDAYQIRGYDASYGSIFLDGLKNGNVAGESNELGGLEQVEVIKGPASGLYGSAPLGGVINLVSKRPKEGRFADVSVGVASFDGKDVSLDANDRLFDLPVLARINVIYRNSGDFVDFAHSERIYVAPSLTWQIAPATSLTVLTRYQRDHLSPWSPVPAYGTILPIPGGKLSISFAVNDDNQRAMYNQDSTQLGYVFEHRFSDAISISQNLRFERSNDDWNNWLFASGVSDDLTTIGRMFYGPFHQQTNDLGVDTRILANAQTYGIRHDMMFGVDYAKSHNVSASDGMYDGWMNPLNLLHPDYSAPLYSVSDGLFPGNSTTEQTGIYVQDHIKLDNRITITVGGRWDWVYSDGAEDTAFSPTVGATWALSPEGAFYFNFAKSFTPNPSYNTRFDGSLLPPETGVNLEGGFKYSSGNLSGMISVFHLTRMNVATDDPAHPFFYIVTGEQLSRGIEVEGAWQPSPAWDMRLAYSYIDAAVTRDEYYPVGMPLPNAPNHNLSLWSQYTVQSGLFENLGVSAGVLYNSKKHFFEGVLYDLPEYVLLDAGLSYVLGSWKGQLNISNLLNKRFFPDACCLDRITPGQPRAVRLRLTKSF